MHKYEIILYWSNEDSAFVAEVPELPGCMAHGDSQDDALKNVNITSVMISSSERPRSPGSPPYNIAFTGQKRAVTSRPTRRRSAGWMKVPPNSGAGMTSSR